MNKQILSMVGILLSLTMFCQAGGKGQQDQQEPAVEIEYETDADVLVSKTYNIAFETENLDSNQVIRLFIETEEGEYIPIPTEQVTPQLIPVNQRTETCVRIIAPEEDQAVRVSFFALEPWDARMISEWVRTENHHQEPCKIIRNATKLGTVFLN